MLTCVEGMRRLFATFVLSAIGWSLLAPIALVATTATAVQACCRRDGKHHCMPAISDALRTSDDGKQAIRVSQTTCPYSTPIILATFQGLHATKFCPGSLGTVGCVAAFGLDKGFAVAARQWFARGPPASLL